MYLKNDTIFDGEFKKGNKLKGKEYDFEGNVKFEELEDSSEKEVS